MKKILLIIALSMVLVMCKTSKTTTSGTADKADTAKPEVAYRDNFKTVSDAEKASTLKEFKATGDTKSLLIMTKNFKGESISVSSGAKKYYTGYPISNMGTGLAERVTIDNTADIIIYDSRSKKEVVLKSSDTQKYKFVYVAKKPGASNPFVVTYSNKLAKFE